LGLWFEILLMQVLLRDVYRNDPRADRTHYSLTEIGDECRHSVMFGKAIGRFGVPAYGPRPKLRQLAKIFPLIAGGAGAYASILIGEEPVDRWQREQMNDERIQPLVRMVSRIHVLEEARHVTFARHELAQAAPKLSRVERLFQQTLTAQAAYLMMRSLVHPTCTPRSGSTRARAAAKRSPTRTTAGASRGWARRSCPTSRSTA